MTNFNNGFSEYEDKLPKVDEELFKTRDEVSKFKSDLEEIKEKKPEEKEKEMNDFVKLINEKFTESTKHLGTVLFPIKGETTQVVLEVENDVEFTQEDNQKEFVRNLIDKEGLKYFPIPQQTSSQQQT